ncbi:MAG: FlgO family outer membrane protein [Rhodothermales bacterium]|nr:FlgO family outer membrane protein [Rhodothermales bacterium]
MRTLDLFLLTSTLLIAGLLIARPVSFQGLPERSAPVDPTLFKKQLRDAMGAYQDADFDRAIDLLAELSYNPEAGRMVRRDALQLLGRAYVARREDEAARQALTSLMDLEPPQIELDPDIESPHLMRVYYDVRKACNKGYSLEHVDPGMKTLAVIDFTNSSIDDHERMEPLSKGLASLLISQLNGASNLKVVERERIQWLLDELDLQQEAGRVDQQTAVRAGKLLGVHAVLLGSYIKHGKDLLVSVRLVSVETGEILATEQEQGRAEDIFVIAQSLSLKVAKGINVALEDTRLGARTETRSLDAMMSYSEGLDLLENEDLRSAYEKFLEALEYDPTYTRAKLKAESLRPLLAVAG